MRLDELEWVYHNDQLSSAVIFQNNIYLGTIFRNEERHPTRPNTYDVMPTFGPDYMNVDILTAQAVLYSLLQ